MSHTENRQWTRFNKLFGPAWLLLGARNEHHSTYDAGARNGLII